MKPRILVIDDENDMLSMYKAVLKSEFDIDTANNGKDGIKKLKESAPDAVILDVIMPQMTGPEVLKKIKTLDPSVEVIMVTASKDIVIAVDCLRAGAYDYIIKPFENEHLTAVINKALERKSLKKENLSLKQVLSDTQPSEVLLGKDNRIKNVLNVIDMVSRNDSTVLITGESGTGKEIVASMIHRKSARKDKPYIAINCAAIPDNLLESELFGHEKGSFTGAYEAHMGKFELASGGTIFLDEIGEMPHNMQAKLLRVVEEGKVSKIGSDKHIPIDVKIIAATNIDIKKAVAEKKFRADLYYRLNVIPIEMPSLRERINDLPIFMEHFLDKYNRELGKDIEGVSKEAMAVFMNYKWPGNVRELENLIERLASLSHSSTIELEDLPSDLLLSSDDAITSTEGMSFQEALEHFEKSMLKKILARNRGNQTRTAKELKIHRTTLISKMKMLGLK